MVITVRSRTSRSRDVSGKGRSRHGEFAMVVGQA
jgi:hypothetical protein